MTRTSLPSTSFRGLKKFRGLLIFTGVLATLPFTLRGLAWVAVSLSLKNTAEHEVSIGSCRISFQGISFRNVDIQWNGSRFSCDEIEFKVPKIKEKGHLRLPVVFQHPQLVLADQSSCQAGLGASLALLLKLDPFVNHGVVEVIEPPERAHLISFEEDQAETKIKPSVHRYYFWSEYLNEQEKIFFFDRNPLPQGEAIASLLMRREGPTVEHYELRIDNLDGSTLLSLVNQQLRGKKIAIRSAPEGIISLRAQGTWANQKLCDLNLEIEGIYAFLSHPHGVIKADEWNARISLDEVPFELEKINLSSLIGQVELRGVEINDDYLSQYLDHGEANIDLQNGLLSGRVVGSLHRDERPYSMEARVTADLVQKSVDINLGLTDFEGKVSQLEVGAHFAKEWDVLVAFGEFPANVITSSFVSSLNPALISSSSFSTKTAIKLLALPIEGKLSGYCQFSYGNEPFVKEADLELHSFSMLNEKENWKVTCPKTNLSLLRHHKTDLLLKTMPITVDYQGEKIGEAQFQLSQNPQTKLAGFIEGNLQGQQMSFSWVGDLAKGNFSLSGSEYSPQIQLLSSKIAPLFNGLEVKGSWNQEKDRVSIEIEKIFNTGHAEVVLFDDGTGGFYFEKLPVKALLPMITPQVKESSGFVRGSGQWSGYQLESSIEVNHFACRDFLSNSQDPKIEEIAHSLSATAPEMKFDCKVDLYHGDFSLESQPLNIEISHPYALQKINFSGNIHGNERRISFRDLKLDSEWGQFHGSGYYSKSGETPELKIELGGGEFLFDHASNSPGMQTFFINSLGDGIHFNTFSVVIPENALHFRSVQNPTTKAWENHFLLMGHLDFPLVSWKGFEVEELEGELIASLDKISLQEARCSFDLPGGKKVRFEEVSLLVEQERKELFSRIDLGNLALMNLHLCFDAKGDQWQLHSHKSTLLQRPLELFAVGSANQIEKWSVTTALEGLICKELFKEVPFLQDNPAFNQDIGIELGSDFGKPDQFKGTVMGMSFYGQSSTSSLMVVAEKEDFHFDASFNWVAKLLHGKGCAITPENKINFATQYSLERGDGHIQVEGDSFATKIGAMPLHVHYQVDLQRDTLANWKVELKQLEGKWDDYSLALAKPTLCQIVTGGIDCQGTLEAFKNKSSWAKGTFQVKKNLLGASLDFDLPKVHFCKNLDFLTPAKLSIESDVFKLSEMEIHCSDVEVYLVDLKENVTLCNSEISFSSTKAVPVLFRSILKTPYNPFDLEVKINPNSAATPAEFALHDKVTGEEFKGGFAFAEKGVVLQFFNGNLLGSVLEGKKNGENFNILFRLSLLNPILNRSFPFLSKFNDLPLLKKAMIELQGNVIYHAQKEEGWVFVGNAYLKGFDLKNAPQANLATRLQYRNNELSITDLQTTQLPFDLKIKKASILFDQEETKFRVPAILMKNFVPSQLFPSGPSQPTKNNWSLTHVSLVDLQGVLTEPKTWKGRGTAHFANMQKGTFTFTKTFSMALEQMGLSSSTLRPAVGDIDFMLDHSKVVLEDLRSCFSEGGATAFVLTPNSRHFIHFDGTLNVELEPKPLQGLPWTQHVRLKIKGNLDQPEYQVR